MQLGIRFGDNDFTGVVRDFFQLYLIPTFIDRSEGHMVTHLTSNIVVQMFNMYMPYLYEYRIVNSVRGNWYSKDMDHRESIGKYLTITESNVYWDGQVDYMVNSMTGYCDSDFTYTDGKTIRIL